MRKLVLALTAATAATLVARQPPAPPADPKAAKQLRTYGVPLRPRIFPQDSPEAALRSAINAIEKGEYPYLVAHLMDPAFVDARVEDRRTQLVRAAADDLARLRSEQQKTPERYPVEVRVPVDPVQFNDRVTAESRRRAFDQVVRDVQDKLADDPQTIREFRRFVREGTVPPAGTAAAVKVTLPDVKDRALFLKRVEDRWFLENRQTEAAAKKE